MTIKLFYIIISILEFIDNNVDFVRGAGWSEEDYTHEGYVFFTDYPSTWDISIEVNYFYDIKKLHVVVKLNNKRIILNPIAIIRNRHMGAAIAPRNYSDSEIPF